MNNPRLSIIIPAYNEAHRLPATLLDIDRRMRNAGYAYEILVVDDGSKDGTAEAARRLEDRIKNLRVLDNKINRGKGAAVNQGMRAAAGEYRLFMDADNSVTIDQLQKFWPEFDGGYDIVIASIEVPGAKITEHAGWHRRLLGKFSKWLIRAVLFLPLHDTQRGFKCFRARTVEPVFSRQSVWRWGFDFEILFVARKFGFKIKEVPVEWNNPGESKVKLGGYVATLKDLFMVRWNDARGRYGKTQKVENRIRNNGEAMKP